MKYRKAHTYKYITTEDYRLLLPKGFHSLVDHEGEFLSVKNNFLIIKKGYRWDGPSGPTFDTPNFMTPSLGHDANYQLIREGIFPRSMQRHADKLLAKMCRDRGMNFFRSIWIYVGVDWFGKYSTKPSKDEGLVIEVN